MNALDVTNKDKKISYEEFINHFKKFNVVVNKSKQAINPVDEDGVFK